MGISSHSHLIRQNRLFASLMIPLIDCFYVTSIFSFRTSPTRHQYQYKNESKRYFVYVDIFYVWAIVLALFRHNCSIWDANAASPWRHPSASFFRHDQSTYTQSNLKERDIWVEGISIRPAWRVTLRVDVLKRGRLLLHWLLVSRVQHVRNVWRSPAVRPLIHTRSKIKRVPEFLCDESDYIFCL